MKHNLRLDILRILACCMVIFMHSPMPDEQANGLFLSTLSYVTAPCIGLFFMVSGALLLPIKTDAFGFLKKRLGKVVIPTLLWSFFYLVVNVWMKNSKVSWLRSVLSLPFSAQGNPVLWFMYTLIGLYLLAPILSRWLQTTSVKELELYLGIWAVSLCYPLLNQFVGLNQGTTGVLYYFTGYVGYFVLGYYLKNYPKRLSFKVILCAMVIAIIAPVVCKIGHIQVNFYEVFWYLSVFVAVQCIFWFKLVMDYPQKEISLKIQSIVIEMSRLSFGIYLVHIFIMRYVLWEWDVIKLIPSYIGQTVAIALLTLLGSVLACSFISLLPKAQYMIGYKRGLLKILITFVVLI